MTTLSEAARELADAEYALHVERHRPSTTVSYQNAVNRYYKALAAYRKAEQKEKQA